MGYKTNSFVISLFFLCTLSGCANRPSPTQRLLNAGKSANQQNWQQITIKSEPFDLVSFFPKNITKQALLTVYFEGDGLAWLNRTTPSLDPTPTQPIGLFLALNHNASNVAYLARPCQFTGGSDAKGCELAYWTNKRFSEEVIAATDVAVDKLKRRFGAKTLQFVGYSGGGATAALLAARRKDVARLVTIAGNLDHVTWTEQHHVSPLTGSLNPADYWQQLKDIPQVHLVGQYDDIVSLEVTDAYRSRFISGMKPTIISIPKFDHHCCWVEQWVEIYMKHTNI